MNHALASFTLSTLMLGVAAPAQDSRPAPAAAAAPQQTAPFYGFQVERGDGTKQKLSDWAGKVVLVVNTASKCGLTPQYAGLEKLHEAHAAKGFAVLAFPANDFGQQEPGTNDEIAKFCKDQYAVTFPVFAKISVKGDAKAPLYRHLTEGGPFPGDIQWNFEKFLIGRDGRVVARFAPKTKPDDPKLVAALEAELAKPAAAAPAPAQAGAAASRPSKGKGK